MNIVCICNPVSGRCGMDELLQDIRRRVEARGARFEWLTTRSARHASELASQAHDAAVILAAGGDGTVCDVINGLAGRRTPLAILPAGTENIVAKELQCARDADGVVRTLFHGRAVDFDVGLANDRRFLVVAGVGFDAEVVWRLVRLRRGHITHASYFGPLLRTFRHHRFPHLTVEIDGRTVFDEPGMVLIGNLPRYSLGLRILDQASFNDGLLDVCAFPCRSRFRLVQHALDVIWERHVGRDGTCYAKGRSVRISSPEPAWVETDGELFGQLPLTCSVSPREVRILTDPHAEPAHPDEAEPPGMDAT